MNIITVTICRVVFDVKFFKKIKLERTINTYHHHREGIEMKSKKTSLINTLLLCTYYRSTIYNGKTYNKFYLTNCLKRVTFVQLFNTSLRISIPVLKVLTEINHHSDFIT